MTTATESPPPDTAANLEDRLCAALDALKAEGRPLTVREIRTKVSDSNSKLLEPIRKVKAEREARARELAAMPPVPDELQAVLESIWLVAWRAADESAAEARKGFSARLAEREAEIAELEAIVRALERERDAAVATEAKMAEELAVLNRECAAALTEAVALRAHVSAAQARLAERDEILGLLRGSAQPAPVGTGHSPASSPNDASPASSS